MAPMLQVIAGNLFLLVVNLNKKPMVLANMYREE
jgi:hypothetical protein